MNYDEVVYKRLIAYRKNEQILEKSKDHKFEIETHHIVPKSLGGTDDPDNLVNLTVVEHVLAHKLLYYIYKFKPDQERAFIQMTCAWHMMLFGHQGECISPRKKVRDIAVAKMSIARHLNKRLNDIMIITDGQTEKEMDKHDPIPDGWTFVRFLNPGTRNKVWINNGSKQTLVYEQDIPDGWVRGQLPSDRAGTYILITNGQETQRIGKDDPIPDGWRRGAHYNLGPIGCKFVNDGEKTICLKAGEEIPEGFVSGFANKPPKRKSINNGVENRAIPEDAPIPEGWVLGQVKGQFKWITDGTECRRLHTGEPMPEGFRRVTTEFHSTKGKIAITDGKTYTFISPGDPIPAGWKLGSSAKTVKGRIYYNNGKVQKAIKPGEKIPKGFVKGKLPYIYINNGRVTKKHIPGTPVPAGFTIGKIEKEEAGCQTTGVN